MKWRAPQAEEGRFATYVRPVYIYLASRKRGDHLEKLGISGPSFVSTDLYFVCRLRILGLPLFASLPLYPSLLSFRLYRLAINRSLRTSHTNKYLTRSFAPRFSILLVGFSFKIGAKDSVKNPKWKVRNGVLGAGRKNCRVIVEIYIYVYRAEEFAFLEHVSS